METQRMGSRNGRGEQSSGWTVNEVADGVVRSPKVLYHFENKGIMDMVRKVEESGRPRTEDATTLNNGDVLEASHHA
jgi:hypothetical protein